jgi:DNA-binding transcriptional regulator GbsR (MarR family)
MDYRAGNMEQRNMEQRMDINWPRNPFESKLNMYERQIDQLFEFSYKDQDDIKTLFNMTNNLKDDLKDDLEKQDINKKITVQIKEINELKTCIQNYYQLELENKRRMENHECYQFQLFIVQIFIICYLIYIRFQ